MTPAPAVWVDWVRHNPTVAAGGTLLLVTLAVAVLAPWLGTVDPLNINPIQRIRAPAAAYWFGTDMLGRDVYSRTLYGSRISPAGFSAAALSTGLGLLIGVVAGYSRALDTVVMRMMDGLMAIPAILLAVAITALSRASLTSVIVALIVPEVPRSTSGSEPRALPARATSRGGRRRPGRQLLARGVPSPPAQHPSAAHCAGHVHLRLCRDLRGLPQLPGAGTPPEIPAGAT